jgi:Tol biopolymer transport system component
VNTRRLFTVLCIGLLSLIFLTPSCPGWAAPAPPDRYPDYGERTQLPWLALQQPQAVSSSDLASASELADWSKLIYQSYRNGNWDIYIASPGGANEQRLTYNAAADIHPRLNRGGTRVVFAAKRTGSYEIYVVNVNGTGLTQLTFTGKDNVNPAWSPAGDRIAFQSYRDGQAEIYVMNADGSNQTRITWDSAYDGEPVWSPDGTQIAFVSGRTGSDHIWLMQANGTELRQFSYYTNIMKILPGLRMAKRSPGTPMLTGIAGKRYL